MGVLVRLGRRGVLLGAAISMTFGLGAGVLAVRWSEAAAAIEVQPSPRAAAAVAPTATPAEPPEPEASVEPAPSRPPLRRVCGQEGRLVRYRVEVERGLPATVRGFARGVSDILCDERGWTASGRVRFRYDPDASIVIRLASPDETERRCLALVGLSVRRMWSCASRAHGEAVLNSDRWFEGSPTWPGDVRRYRRLLVNHEVGHVLGHRHRGCSAAGQRAPVMMQQSKGTAGCTPNVWPTRAELRATR